MPKSKVKRNKKAAVANANWQYKMGLRRKQRDALNEQIASIEENKKEVMEKIEAGELQEGVLNDYDERIKEIKDAIKRL